jgi:hypothetical protein
VNGVVPWSEDVPGRTALILGTSRGPGFSLPHEAALDDAMPIPKAFDIVDLGTKKLGLPGYPRAPLLPANWWQVVGGGGIDMFVGHDCAPTTEGDTDHGWSGCSTTSLGQSLDGREKLLYLIFFLSSLCFLTPSFF